MKAFVENKYLSSCRVCLLNNSEDVGMLVMFTTKYQSMTIADILSTCTSLQIVPADGLPPLICTKCLGHLTAAYEFQKQCHKSDRELRKELDRLRTTLKDETKNVQVDIQPPMVCINLDESDSCSISSEKLDKKVDSKDELQCKSLTEENQVVSGTVELATANKLRTNAIKTYECLLCKKVFKSANVLRRHMIVHDDLGKPYECEVCRYRYATEINLRRHALRHTDTVTAAGNQRSGDSQTQKEYKCKICHKTFDKLQKLSCHSVQSHDEFKKHECRRFFILIFLFKFFFNFFFVGLCGERFSLPRQLIAHKTGHSGERPFVCRLCNKGEKLWHFFLKLVFLIRFRCRFSTNVCT